MKGKGLIPRPCPNCGRTVIHGEWTEETAKRGRITYHWINKSDGRHHRCQPVSIPADGRKHEAVL